VVGGGRRRMAALRSGLTLLLLAASCGDPLAGGDFLGEARYRFPCETTGSSSLVPPGTKVAVSLFWSPQGARVTDPARLVEQVSQTRVLDVPLSFSFELRDEPAGELLHTTAGGATYGIARVLGYRDDDGDRRHDPGEPFVGQASKRVLLYAPKAVPAAESPTGLELPAGFALSSLPLACAPVTEESGSEECGVPLGDACESDADCGRGRCTEAPNGPALMRACTLRYESGGCRPANAKRVRDDDLDVWVNACRVHKDCDRGPPFQCDVRAFACLPTRGAMVQLGDAVVIPPACAPAP
jgi:hypothetical protein